MELIIAKMRADWPVVAADRRSCGDWTEQDEKEIGAAVAAVVAKKDADSICMWARWLADLSAIAMGLKVASVTKKMRDQAKKQRDGAVP